MMKSRRMRWAEHVVRMGKKRNAYRLLVRMLEGKGSQGRPKCRWVDNIEMDLRYDGVVWDWIDLAQDRDQWKLMSVE
jgi:hypothetical protein